MSKLMKVVVVGNSGVGKSCLLTRFTEDHYDEHHDITIGVEFGAKTLDTSHGQVKLQIWDTAGQEDFRSITTSYFRGAHVALLCFDVTRRNTFAELGKWLNDIAAKTPEDIVIHLVGVKVDLKGRRRVSDEEAEQFVKDNGLNGYTACSAKTGANVDDAFVKPALVACSKLIFDVETGDVISLAATSSSADARTLKNAYLRNGGSCWQAGKIFGVFKLKPVDDCYNNLEQRRNKAGASAVTLRDNPCPRR